MEGWGRFGSRQGATMVVLTRFHILTLAFALLLSISGASFAAQGSRHSRSAVVKNHSVTTSRADVSRMPARSVPRALRGIRMVRGSTFLIPTDHMETLVATNLSLNSNVRFCPIADIPFCTAYVRFWGVKQT